MEPEEDEYTESDISLMGRYPSFDSSKFDLRFSNESPSGSKTCREEQIEAIVEQDSAGKILRIAFPHEQKLKIQRVAVKYLAQTDVVYVRLCRHLRQEYSIEFSQLNDEIIIDLDQADRIIGIAITNASTNIPAQSMQNLSSSDWIVLYSVPIKDLIDDRKAKKAAKRDLAKSALSAEKAALQRRLQLAEKKRKFNLIPHETPVSVQVETTYLQQKFTRDLEWVLNSPFLLHQGSSWPIVPSNWVDMLQDPSGTLRNLDALPSTLIEWARGRTVRSNNLGGYFSLLLHFWMCKCPSFERIHVKYQMFDGRRTIGDMDFVFWDSNTNQITQWEAGIKFYLLLPTATPADGLEALVGPHCTGDSLGKYVRKTMQQLSAKDNPQIKSQLVEHNMYPGTSLMFLKGYLFYPLSEEFYSGDQSVPDAVRLNRLCHFTAEDFVNLGVSPNHSKGWWARYHHEFSYDPLDIQRRIDAGEIILGAISSSEILASEYSEAEEFEKHLEEDVLLLETDDSPLKKHKLATSRWIILNKHDYMSPAWVTPDRVTPADGRSDGRIVPMSYSVFKRAIKRHFQKNFRSVFVAEIVPWELSQYRDCPNPMGTQYVEVSRGFVVGNYWPYPPASLAGFKKLL